MRRFLVVVALLGVAALPAGQVSAKPKPPTACKTRGLKTYPGDNASRSDIAQWMAEGATKARLPAELPVMAALVESGLRNLPGGDRDSAGFFQMRIGIWNEGAYLGFPDHPDLQLQWFVDQALIVEQARIAAGESLETLLSDDSGYGEWVADVIRPPEEFRGRYQLRLDEARSLICSTA